MSNDSNESLQFQAITQLSHLIKEVGPKNNKTLEIINEKNLLWRKIPYLHEQVILKLFAGLIEKGDSLNQSDINNIVVLLTWIKNLDQKQFSESERIQNRAPLFMNENFKKTLGCQIKCLKNSTFLNQENPFGWLRGIIRSYAGELDKSDIIKFNLPNFESEIVKNSKKSV